MLMMINELSDAHAENVRKPAFHFILGQPVRYVSDCVLVTGTEHKALVDTRRVVITSTSLFVSVKNPATSYSLDDVKWAVCLRLAEIVGIEQDLVAHATYLGSYSQVTITHRCAIVDRDSSQVVGYGNRVESIRLSTCAPTWRLPSVLRRGARTAFIRSALPKVDIQIDMGDKLSKGPIHSAIKTYILLEAAFLDNPRNLYIVSQMALLAPLSVDVKRAFWTAPVVYRTLMKEFNASYRVLAGHLSKTVAEVPMMQPPTPAPKQLPWPFAPELKPECPLPKPVVEVPTAPAPPPPVSKERKQAAVKYLIMAMTLLTGMLFDSTDVRECRCALSEYRPYRFTRLLNKVLSIPSLPLRSRVRKKLIASALPLLWELHELTLVQSKNAQRLFDIRMQSALGEDQDLQFLATTFEYGAAGTTADTRRLHYLLQYFRSLCPDLVQDAQRIYGTPLALLCVDLD